MSEEVKIYGCKPIDDRNKICAFETEDNEGMVLIDKKKSRVLVTKVNKDIDKKKHMEIKKKIEDEI